jgi:hypothetical protein
VYVGVIIVYHKADLNIMYQFLIMFSMLDIFRYVEIAAYLHVRWGSAAHVYN